MFSKEESIFLRQEFWTSFGKSFPYKWTLYNTKIKDFSFKFYFDTKKAMVMLDIEGSLENREKYYEKIYALRNILAEEYSLNLNFDFNFLLENGIKILGKVQWNFSLKICKNLRVFGLNMKIL